ARGNLVPGAPLRQRLSAARRTSAVQDPAGNGPGASGRDPDAAALPVLESGRARDRARPRRGGDVHAASGDRILSGVRPSRRLPGQSDGGEFGDGAGGGSGGDAAQRVARRIDSSRRVSRTQILIPVFWRSSKCSSERAKLTSSSSCGRRRIAETI